MTLGKEEKLEQLEKLLRSRSLHDAETLKAFLRFVVTKSIECEHEHIKEYVIATAVLGRNSDYDPNVDSAVRVHARRLRAKLQEYYATEGKDDKVVIDLPKGHYSPTFTYVHDENNVAVQQPEELRLGVAEKSEPPKTSVANALSLENQFPASAIESRSSLNRTLQIALAAFAILSLILGSTTLSYRSEAKRLMAGQPVAGATMAAAGLQALSPLWKDFLSSPDPILIVYSNALFEGTPTTGMRFWKPMYSSSQGGSASQFVPPVEGAVPGQHPAYIYDTYTGIGEVMGVYFLGHALSSAGRSFRVKRSTLLTWDDPKSMNLIFLGSPAENHFLRDLPQEQNFVFQMWDKKSGELQIVNLAPRPGEQKVFSLKRDGYSSQHIQEDYAVISMLKGLNLNQRILILAGLTTISTQAAAEYVTKPEYISELTAKLNTAPGESARSLPDYYQAVIKVKVNGGVPVQISYVTHHVLK